MKKSGCTDDDLYKLLQIVDLKNITDRYTFDTDDKDWNDVLSGGEKQRIAMARLYYHKPKYAILDECTSACSIEIEGKMYLHAKSLGITLITVSHRRTLWKFHDYLLKFTGDVRVL
jgi:ABC-type uncharacterized transport system fused permease/ATPase subunit